MIWEGTRLQSSELVDVSTITRTWILMRLRLPKAIMLIPKPCSAMLVQPAMRKADRLIFTLAFIREEERLIRFHFSKTERNNNLLVFLLFHTSPNLQH